VDGRPQKIHVDTGRGVSNGRYIRRAFEMPDCEVKRGTATYSGRASIPSFGDATLSPQETASTSVVRRPSGGVCVSPGGNRICVCGRELPPVASARLVQHTNLQTEPCTLCACVCYFSILQCNKRGKRARSHADERTGSNAVDGLNVRGLVVRLKMLPEKASALLDRCRRKLHVWLRGEMPPR